MRHVHHTISGISKPPFCIMPCSNQPSLWKIGKSIGIEDQLCTGLMACRARFVWATCMSRLVMDDMEGMQTEDIHRPAKEPACNENRDGGLYKTAGNLPRG
jgi:hypothetical protein